MPLARRRSTTVAALSAAVLVAAGAVFAADLPKADQPTGEAPSTTRPAARSPKAIVADLQTTGGQLSAALNGGVIADPAKRQAAAPTVNPLLHRYLSLVTEFYTAQHAPPLVIAGQRQQFEGMLYLFGDKQTCDRVDAAPTADSAAQAVRLRAAWIAADSKADAQKPVADEVQKAAAAHPDNADLTTLAFACSSSAADPAVKSQLMATVTGTMKNPAATEYARMAKAQAGQQKAMAAAMAKQKEMVGKPFTVEATTVEGKPFTSADYKGKVVLVDFWASWCGPCKAELPRVKELYAQYHDKGLEIIGVDNDYAADDCTGYASHNGMPWVELFNASAAAKHQWNPTTTGNGIFGIPVMFLIDKKGVLRTVEARASMETDIPKLLAE